METAELDKQQKIRACIHEYNAAAKALLEQVAGNWNDLPRDRAIEIAVFSALESQRTIDSPQSKKMSNFYWMFLLFTACMPFAVMCTPVKAHVLAWDFCGIASTMVLLLVTYGFYTVQMASRFWWTIFDVFTFPPRATLAKAHSVRGISEFSDDRGELASFVNVVLLLLGISIGVIALSALWHLYPIVDRRSPLGTFNHLYKIFFGCVMALSFTFILMDLTVAIFEESHTESFIAASSAAHATIPMFFGVLLVGTYIFLQAHPLSIFPQPHGHTKIISVELASGALTFQMIMSNVLFILIKKNLVFRFLYNTVRSTRS